MVKPRPRIAGRRSENQTLELLVEILNGIAVLRRFFASSSTEGLGGCRGSRSRHGCSPSHFRRAGQTSCQTVNVACTGVLAVLAGISVTSQVRVRLAAGAHFTENLAPE
jgi:hypothetical protein